MIKDSLNKITGAIARGFVAVMVAGLLLWGCKTALSPQDDYASSQEQEVELNLPQYQPATPRVFDIIHTKLDLEFDWENKWVIGEASLLLKPYFYPQDQLVLDAKSFEILACDLLDSASKSPLSYTYDGNAIFIDLGKSYLRHDTLEIQISYIAKPYERTPEAGQAITSDRGLFFINPLETDSLKPRQLWTQGETEFNSCWFPTIDSPNERFTQEIFLTVDSILTTLSNGELQSTGFLGNGLKRDHWKLGQPHAPYLAMIAVGNFARVADTAGDIPLGYYVEPAYEPYALDIFGNTPEMIMFFSTLLDYPYPWPKYDQVVVKDYVSGAMENTTASVFMEDVQVNDRELLDDHWDGIIAHELFHQWFGNLVTCESWANLALNEGFANYSEYLWNEYKYGKEEADYNLWIEKNNYMDEVASGKLDPIINYFYENPDDLFDSHRYSKAGLVLHMLRNYVGDEAFFASLNQYLKTNAYQSVEIDDLRNAFERTTGEDLQWFFEQWFELPGHPALEVTSSYENDSLKINVTQLQVSDSIGMFVFPLEVEIWQGESSISHEWLVDAPEMSFTLPLATAPSLVEIDPNRVLLAEIHQPKTIEELLSAFSNRSTFALRREALETLFTEGDSLAIGGAALHGLTDPSPRIREMTLDNLIGRGHLHVAQIREGVSSLTADSSALVRAAAFSAYGETGAADIEAVVKGSLSDSSYSVVGAGLELLLPDYIEDPVWLDEYTDIRNLNVATPIAGYYNQRVKPGKLTWYHNNLLHFKGMERWLFLQYYIEYLVLTEQYKATTAIDVLKYLATQDGEFYIRIAAFQSLTLVLPGSEENKQVLIAIANSEQDKRAREIMNGLLLTER